jgi:hypothetical protein
MTAAAEIGTRAKPWTPYRRGRVAGSAHAAAFRAWRALPMVGRGPSPTPPSCPYTAPKSVDGWQVGFRRSMALHS